MRKTKSQARVSNRITLGAAALFFMLTSPLVHAQEAQWITAHGLDGNHPVVLHFRREINMARLPKSFPVHVTADNRFVLYVNGQRVGEGPARGDLAHWRYEAFDLAHFLHQGRNVIAAEVWNAVTPKAGFANVTAPLAQISAKTAFWLSEPDKSPQRGIESGSAWRVSIQEGHTFSSPYLSQFKQLPNIYYVAGAQETIDAAKIDWQWNGQEESNAGWANAVPALGPDEHDPWTLMMDPLPRMSYSPVPSGKVVRTDFADAKAFPDEAVKIPPHSMVHLLIDRGIMVSGYPQLTVTGGTAGKITVTYAEALYDAAKRKGDRDEVQDRSAIGLADTFLPDGGEKRVFSPLWWRVWRYMDVTVQTSDQPLTLDRLQVHESGYPFEERAVFDSDDPQLNEIWSIGWRTLKIDAHETFMDSAYWEQLQYVGDTRLEALVAYSVSGDPRLPVQAIDAFGESQRADGLTESAYPSSGKNIIPPFSLLWIDMMHDYWMHQADWAVLRRNLPGARRVLKWYAQYAAPNGLLRRNPDWNFIDWVGTPPLARNKFPSFDPASGTSCLTSLVYLGALKDAAELESALGDPTIAEDDWTEASALRSAIQNACWNQQSGLYADDPSMTVFSQHANALAVLYDVASREKAPEILRKISLDHGIDAPDGVLTTSYYFSWYLVRAYEHAGMPDRYFDLLETWRDLLKLHYTTWPEERGNTRSDTHAWSAHPTDDLLGIVAGVQPASAGYATVRVTPHLGSLNRLRATAMTPTGPVSVLFSRGKEGSKFQINLPEGLTGRFQWDGAGRHLHSGLNKFKFKGPA